MTDIEKKIKRRKKILDTLIAVMLCISFSIFILYLVIMVKKRLADEILILEDFLLFGSSGFITVLLIISEKVSSSYNRIVKGIMKEKNAYAWSLVSQTLDDIREGMDKSITSFKQWEKEIQEIREQMSDTEE